MAVVRSAVSRTGRSARQVRMFMEVSMATRIDRPHDYFTSSFDGSFWPAVLVIAAMLAIAAAAWMTS
jgi:hypothetical protein